MRIREPLYVKVFLSLLECCPFGALTLKGPNGNTWYFKGKNPGVQADLEFHDWKVINTALSRGDIGVGETYVQGLWDSNDIGNLVAYFISNVDYLNKYIHGNSFQRYITSIMNTLFRRNSVYRSRLNIISHYDLGNEFYELWLDPTMTYSSGLRYLGTEDLEQSQHHKYDRILNKIEKRENVLEIGCGWGGFADKAASKGLEVTSLTISPSQFGYAKERVNAKANILLEDYRNTKGVFESIVSIEMFEAVGESYWPIYFETIKKRLQEGGDAIIQTITIKDEEFEGYRKRSDYLRQYIFPGGMLPSPQKFEYHANKAGLELKETFFFGQDYAWTIREWERRFLEAKNKIIKLGFSDQFIRSWLYYFGLCSGAFEMKRINVMQAHLSHTEKV